METKLIEVLGRNAFDSHNMQVSNDIASCVRTIIYLQTQLKLALDNENSTEEDRKDLMAILAEAESIFIR